jgi:hypothetical protein
VYDDAARRKLHARIDALTAGAQPRQQMNVGQMIAHCDPHLRHSLGEFATPVNKPIRFFPRTPLDHLPAADAKGVPTMNEMVIPSRARSKKTASSCRTISKTGRTGANPHAGTRRVRQDRRHAHGTCSRAIT